MSTTQTQARPVAPGERAPDFTLPAVHDPGTVSLGDYRGRSHLLLALLIGLWCPFCRRQLALLGASESRLREAGVETLAVVATEPDNARLYFKFRPTRLRLAADPELSTHRAYGLPRPAPTPEFMEALDTVPLNPFGLLPAPLPAMRAAEALGKLDGYAPTAVDESEMQRQFPQLKGLFLIDREGIVRWTYIECADEGMAGVGKIPSGEELLAAAQALPR